MPVDTTQFNFLAKKKGKQSSEEPSSLSDCQKLLFRTLKQAQIKSETKMSPYLYLVFILNVLNINLF